MKEEMKKQQIGRQAPAFAIVESNTLAVMGLRQLLESAIPSAQIQAFGTFGELQASNPEHFIHFFVSMHIVLANRNFSWILNIRPSSSLPAMILCHN